MAVTASFAAPIDLTDSVTEPTLTANAHFGRAVVTADFDGDGIDDLAVGATGHGAGQQSLAGEVTVFLTDGGTPVTLYSTQPETAPAFGQTLAIGDIDGDGLQDLVVGSPFASVGPAIRAGEVSVFFGPDFSRTIVVHDPQPQLSAAFGISVAAGDTNGDGFDEVVAGAWDSNVGSFGKAGQAFVFTGPSLTQVTTLQSPEPESVADFGVASAVGDVDGDGFADVIVGSWLADVPPGSDNGKVFVFHGPALADSDKLIDGGAGRRLGRSLAAGDVDGNGAEEVVAGASQGAVLFTYVAPNTYAPKAVSRMGGVAAVSVRDANGDGWADVLLGSPDDDTANINAGGATLLLGPDLMSSWDLEMVQPQAEARVGTGVAIGSYPDGALRAFASAPQLDVSGAEEAGAVFFVGVHDPDHDAWLGIGDNCPLMPNPDQSNSDSASLPNGPLVPGDDVTILYGDDMGDACDSDDDNDGLFDADESSGAFCSGIVTSGLLIDTDGDHLTDGWECAHGSDPTNAASKFLGTAGADVDGDHIPDVWEQRGYNASGSSIDSDGDGCADLVEVASVDGNKTVTDVDRLGVARRAFGIWAADAAQDYALDLNKNGPVDDADRLFVARAALLADWLPKSCP